MTAVASQSAKPFTLYTSKLCPYAQRAELALDEAGVNSDVERVEIDLLKPRESWYLETVNPVGKVPALKISRDGDSTVIPESLVIANYVAEAFPPSKLLPEDPVHRARVRYVIERASQIIQPHYPSALMKRDQESLDGLVNALIELDKLLSSFSSSGPYVFGEQPNLADFAIAPFLGRILVNTAPEVGIVPREKLSPSIPERIRDLPRLKSFYDAVAARPSWTRTFDADHVRTVSAQRFLNKA